MINFLHSCREVQKEMIKELSKFSLQNLKEQNPFEDREAFSICYCLMGWLDLQSYVDISLFSLRLPMFYFQFIVY